MTRRALTLLALVVAASLGCDKKAEGEKAESGETKLADDDVSVVGDFVEEAETQITPDNYKSELDKLEAEADKE